MHKKILYPFLIIIFFATMVSVLLMRDNASPDTNKENIQYLLVGGVRLRAELATTKEKQTQGLSGREALAQEEGMLFVFDQPGKFNFWMKDMNFAIDMIWIGEDRKIIYIKKDARPEDFPESFGPDQEAKYVLEVVSGFSEKNNLRVGDEIVFTN